MISYYDINNYSCLNGWTFGNVVASARDVAMLYHDLLGAKVVVNSTTVEMMTHLQNYTYDFPCVYGLGLMETQFRHQKG